VVEPHLPQRALGDEQLKQHGDGYAHQQIRVGIQVQDEPQRQVDAHRDGDERILRSPPKAAM
jgi:hypothetical protein